jgi:putative nucleotidyltransferase with HDIG domain
MDRSTTLDLVKSWTKSPNLIKHMLSVEAAMRSLARYFHEDEELWGTTGLVHDLDYEKLKETPKKHPSLIFAELAKHNYDPRIIQAIRSHAWGWQDDAPEPSGNMEWSLYLCDELTGLVIACALVHPDKKLAAVTVETVMRKFPKKDFAKGVDRERFKLIEPNLGMTTEEFVGICLSGLQSVSADLGL